MKFIYFQKFIFYKIIVSCAIINCFVSIAIAFQKFDHKILFLYRNPKSLLSTKRCGKGELSISNQLRGSNVYKKNLFKHVVDNKIDARMLIVNDQILFQELISQRFPCQLLEIGLEQKNNYRMLLQEHIKKICKNDQIDIIHCHTTYEALLVSEIAHSIKARVVMTLHIDSLTNHPALKKLDGIIGVNDRIVRIIEQNKKKKSFSFRAIASIAPFFDETKFVNFKTEQTAQEFFKKNFDITLKNIPIVCSIANFYPNYKNHAVLLKAAHKLIFCEKKPIQLVLAGIGPRMEEMQIYAKKLNIQDYVYFIGHTDKISELLYHIDIKALTSNQDAFPIALLEAALMKKPLIGTAETGMEHVIKHEKTGLLFKANDHNDLATKIKMFLDNRIFAKKIGENACLFVQEQYSTQTCFFKLIHFYNNVLKNKKSM